MFNQKICFNQKKIRVPTKKVSTKKNVDTKNIFYKKVLTMKRKNIFTKKKYVLVQNGPKYSKMSVNGFKTVQNYQNYARRSKTIRELKLIQNGPKQSKTAKGLIQ